MNRPVMKPKEEEEKITYHGFKSPMSFDEVWPKIREVMAFVGGFGIMFYEALADSSDRPWLYAAAIGMMGLPLARVAESTLGRLGGSGPQEEPPQIRRRRQSRYYEDDEDRE